MENTAFKKLSDKPPKLPWCHAIWDLLTLNAATSLASGVDSLKGPYENIGLVSALLLTMVQLGNPDVGSELVSYEWAYAMYLHLILLNTAFFFSSTLLSAFIALYASCLESDASALDWVEACPLMFKLDLGVFFMGLLTYITLVIMQYFSYLGMNAITVSLAGCCVAIFFLAVYCLCDSYRTVYPPARARRELVK